MILHHQQKKITKKACSDIPWFAWLIGSLLLIGLLVPFLYFLITSPQVNPAFRTASNTRLRSSFVNNSEVIVIPSPCIDPTDPNYNFTNSSTFVTKNPLCNSTTTTIYRNYQANSQDIDIANGSNKIHEFIMNKKIFNIYLLTIALLFLIS